MANPTRFTNDSPEVNNSVTGRHDLFIKSCTRVNGSKYVRSWSKDNYEIETDLGVFITEKDVSAFVKKTVSAQINEDPQKRTVWKWINILEDEHQSSLDSKEYLLEEIADKAIPKKQCAVYQIEIGAESYIGFTTRDPKIRLQEHIDAAKKGSDQPVHKQMRNWGYFYSFSVLGQFENEVEALVNERLEIIRRQASLNNSKGGEGVDFQIFQQVLDDEDRLYVLDKYGKLSSSR